MISYTDANLEAKIGAEYNAMVAACVYEVRKFHFDAMVELVRQRSSQRIEIMERERNLRP